MTNNELLVRFNRTRSAFMQVACQPVSVPSWGHLQETSDWLETLRMIQERFPECTYPASQGEYYLRRAIESQISNQDII